MKPTEKKPFRTTVVIQIDGLYDPTRMDEDEAREAAAGKAVGDALAHIHTVEDGLEITDIINLLQQELPEVELEEEINKFFENVGMPIYWCNDAEQREFCSNLARHFWNKGYNARKEE